MRFPCDGSLEGAHHRPQRSGDMPMIARMQLIPRDPPDDAMNVIGHQDKRIDQHERMMPRNIVPGAQDNLPKFRRCDDAAFDSREGMPPAEAIDGDEVIAGAIVVARTNSNRSAGRQIHRSRMTGRSVAPGSRQCGTGHFHRRRFSPGPAPRTISTRTSRYGRSLLRPMDSPRIKLRPMDSPRIKLRPMDSPRIKPAAPDGFPPGSSCARWIPPGSSCARWIPPGSSCARWIPPGSSCARWIPPRIKLRPMDSPRIKPAAPLQAGFHPYRRKFTVPGSYSRNRTLPCIATGNRSSSNMPLPSAL
jgi:hypothetical protein